ncbi:MAG: PHA/PHB synthase family protein [Oxalobacteraceae bacterium]
MTHFASRQTFMPSAREVDDAVHERLSQFTMGLSPISLALACADWAMHLATSPGRQMELAERAMQLIQDELQASARRTAGVAEEEKDARFSDPAWSQWPYSMLKDSFKAGDTWWKDATQVDGMSEHRQQMVSFFARQWMDAMSPSNWALTNPEVFRKAWETGGQSVMQGLKLFLQDMQQSHLPADHTNPDHLQPLPYGVGKEVAVTPGKVVFRNPLFELIQYTATTNEVAVEPLLIIPSPIMKYYIMDLSPNNSMVRYLVSQGYTVFMISWRNPDASDRDLGMDDYLQAGVMQAMRKTSELAASREIHAMGYCLGGTFLAIVAALMGADEFAAEEASKKAADQLTMPTLRSVTLLAAQTDFSEAGELGIFIDDDQLKTLREQVARTGYLSGRQMAGTFQFLHSKDLIWSRNTQRYLMGVDETGSDLMSWNADTTRLPQRMHSEYLETLFLRDDLTEGHYKVAGVPVALKNLRMPLMVVGTVRDHVSPWRSVYKIHLFTDTDTTFILASGGHNAGIVSEPGHLKRGYQISREQAGHDWVDPDAWIARAPRRDGSWWEAWSQWLLEQSSARIPARAINEQAVVCDAPGDYVMVRYAD